VRKGANHERLAECLVAESALLPEVLGRLGSDEPHIKYGCSKVLRLLSEKQPALLYPRFLYFAGLLHAGNSFIKWDAARIVANLAVVDSDGLMAKTLDRYLEPICGPVMITAATAIQGASRIALARPELAARIVRAVLKVERAHYQTAECRNVAIGHAVDSFNRFFNVLEPKEQGAVLEFVSRQRRNKRTAVRKKAAAFLKRHERWFATSTKAA
jgi:hypothetical protein